MIKTTFLDTIKQKGAFQIFDTLGDENVARTPAQRVNKFSLTASLYEGTWRKRSIRVLTGKPFTLDDEAQLLNDWLSPDADSVILDIGCSTAYYARRIACQFPETTSIAIDYSWPMLRQAQRLANSENSPVHFVRANAEKLPFEENEIDAICCGGTLNEFHSAENALKEMYRVLKPGGKLFVMYLGSSSSMIGKIIQKLSALGGISFWTETESDKLFMATGFQPEKKQHLGVVRFELFTK